MLNIFRLHKNTKFSVLYSHTKKPQLETKVGLQKWNQMTSLDLMYKLSGSVTAPEWPPVVWPVLLVSCTLSLSTNSGPWVLDVCMFYYMCLFPCRYILPMLVGSWLQLTISESCHLCRKVSQKNNKKKTMKTLVNIGDNIRKWDLCCVPGNSELGNFRPPTRKTILERY